MPGRERTGARRVRRLGPIVAVAMVAVACGDGRGETATPDPGDAAAPTPAATTPDRPSDPSSVASASPLDEQTAWALDALNGATVSEADFDARFAEVFAQQVPYGSFVDVLEQQLQPAGPFTEGDTAPGPGGAQVVELTGRDGAGFALTIGLDDDDRIETLFVGQAEPSALDDPPATLDEAVERLQGVGELHLLAADVEEDGCVPTAEVAADERVPVASAIKLYVLGAVARSVVDGELAWQEPLDVADTVAGGLGVLLQQNATGGTVTVEQAAQLMIEASDNGATDLLIDAVGSGAVERAQGDLGHGDPARNIPFLTAREATLLKADEAAGDAWVAAPDAAARRDVLDTLEGRSVDDEARAALTAGLLRPREIEWFASPRDLCTAMARLVTMADDPGLAPLEQILTANPGVAGPPGRWSRIAYKGGSEPGVLTLAWLVEDGTGARHALVASLVGDAPFEDEARIAMVAGAARDLLGDP